MSSHNKLSSQSNTTDLLPPWTYESNTFLELEIEQLFRRHWMLVGHISDIPLRGDFTTFDAFDEQVVVVRGHDNNVRAFHNVCQHRGGRVVAQKSGNRAAITCPFHGWCYGLDGALLNVPAFETFKDLSVESLSLVAVEHEIWMGFIFIRLQRGGTSIAEQLAPIAEEVSYYQPEALQPYSPAFEEIKPFNWKCIHDIDNEGYHVPVGHPALNELYGDSYRDTIEHGIMVARGSLHDKLARNWSVRHYQKLLPEFDHLPQDRQRLWFYMMSYPNTVFGFYPDMMEIYMTIPNSVDQTRYISRTYALPDVRRETRAARYLNVRINTETSTEDDTYIGWLQQGMKSSAWREPYLSSLEEGVRHFHHRIQDALPVARLRNSPAEHEVANTNAHLLANMSI